MSDTFEGPGWWMASDGKWYAPERHPDPNYRARFVPEPEVVGAEAADASTDEATSDTGEGAAAHIESVPETAAGQEMHAVSEAVFESEPAAEAVFETEPAVEPGFETEPAAEPGFESGFGIQPGADAVFETQSGVEPAFDELVSEREPIVEDVPVVPEAEELSSEPAPSRPIPEVRVGRSAVFETTERPVFDRPPPASVAESRVRSGAAELELDRPSVSGSGTSPSMMHQLAAEATAPTVRSASSALVPVERAEFEPVTMLDRVIATLIFVSGVAMIVGTFLTWIEGQQVDQTGWDRGDGLVTVVAGILGSAAAGPIYVGFRNVIPKATAIIAGLVGLVVVGLAAISALSDGAGTTIGLGIIIVGIASATLALAGLADRGDRMY